MARYRLVQERRWLRNVGIGTACGKTLFVKPDEILDTDLDVSAWVGSYLEYVRDAQVAAPSDETKIVAQGAAPAQTAQPQHVQQAKVSVSTKLDSKVPAKAVDKTDVKGVTVDESGDEDSGRQ